MRVSLLLVVAMAVFTTADYQSDIAEYYVESKAVYMRPGEGICDAAVNIVIGCHACEHFLLCPHPNDTVRDTELTHDGECHSYVEYCLPLVAFKAWENDHPFPNVDPAVRDKPDVPTPQQPSSPPTSSDTTGRVLFGSGVVRPDVAHALLQRTSCKYDILQIRQVTSIATQVLGEQRAKEIETSVIDRLQKKRDEEGTGLPSYDDVKFEVVRALLEESDRVQQSKVRMLNAEAFAAYKRFSDQVKDQERQLNEFIFEASKPLPDHFKDQERS